LAGTPTTATMGLLAMILVFDASLPCNAETKNRQAKTVTSVQIK
jgi:hypothetical protein